jgi:hypothetical protein
MTIVSQEPTACIPDFRRTDRGAAAEGYQGGRVRNRGGLRFRFASTESLHRGPQSLNPATQACARPLIQVKVIGDIANQYHQA